MAIHQTGKWKTAKYLETNGEMTVVDAQELYISGSSLAVNIHRLRREGWPIISEKIPGKAYVKYILLPDE